MVIGAAGYVTPLLLHYCWSPDEMIMIQGHVCPGGARCFHLSKGKCWFKGGAYPPGAAPVGAPLTRFEKMACILRSLRTLCRRRCRRLHKVCETC